LRGLHESGYRLGYGGGYYDRTLAAAPRPLAVGVCHSFGRVGLRGEAHDAAGPGHDRYDEQKSRTRVRLVSSDACTAPYFTSCCQIASVGPAWFSE
jgi:hypothetical protein